MKHMDLSNRTDDGLYTKLLICLTYACRYMCDIDCTSGMFVENIYNTSNTSKKSV